jgi:hypothetical protein
MTSENRERKLDEVGQIIRDATIELMNDVMDDFIERDEWDIPAVVGAITISMQMRGITPILDRDDELWNVGPTGHPLEGVYAATARLITDPIFPVTDPEGNKAMVMGVIMLNEGYSITEPSKEGAEYWNTHSIKDDPRGVECIVCTAITVEGNFSLTQPRGGERQQLLEGGEGRVFDALQAMFIVLSGQQVGKL